MIERLKQSLQWGWLSMTAILLFTLQPVPSARAVPPGVPEPIGEWLFNGDLLDSTTNGNHGVPSGGPVFVETPRGMGLSLDGVDDMVDFGTNELFEFSILQSGLFPFQTNDMSIEVWVSIDDDPLENGNQCVDASGFALGFAKGEVSALGGCTDSQIHNLFGKNDTNTHHYMLTYESSPLCCPELHRVGFAFTMDSGSCRPCLEDSSPAELGTFIHVVGTKSSANAPANQAAAIWRNGTRANASGGFGNLEPGPEVPLTIGPLVVDTGGGVLITNYLKAVYEEVRLYNDYLTDDQIQALFEAGPTHIFEPLNVVDAGVGDQVFTEFLSEAGTTYALECTTDLVFSNNWSATGAIVEGTGGTLTLYDPAGYSTSKLYRVAIQL